jgi:hypothetical protein
MEQFQTLKTEAKSMPLTHIHDHNTYMHAPNTHIHALNTHMHDLSLSCFGRDTLYKFTWFS